MGGVLVGCFVRSEGGRTVEEGLTFILDYCKEREGSIGWNRTGQSHYCRRYVVCDEKFGRKRRLRGVMERR